MSRLVTHPAAILEQPAVRVDATHRDTLAVAGELLTVLKETPNALAIAAPQVGSNFSMFAYDDPEDGPTVLSNPVIVDMSQTRRLGWEGCLSFPGQQFRVPRHVAVVLRAHDILGEPVRLPFHDLMARMVQHEVDHLHGILVTERAVQRRRVP